MVNQSLSKIFRHNQFNSYATKERKKNKYKKTILTAL